MAAGLVEERMLAALSSAIAVLAALLAAIGIYSTVAAGVARRQREIGVRMALGAVPGQVTWKVVGETCGIVAVGLVIAFHCSVDALEGGFVGVDVFFVLSGYLVTGVLLLALGAQQGDVIKQVMRHGFLLAALGIVIGGAAALGLTRAMATLLHDVSPSDPLTFTAVTLVLAGVALLGSWLPARRAAGVDPVEALRTDA